MLSVTKLSIIPILATALLATDASWKNKPIAQWDDHDAKQFLVDSPWIKYSRPAALPEQSEAARREGGVMGGGQNGLGVDVLKQLNPFGFGSAREEDKATLLPAVPIRWESASPVRAAEAKIGAPTWQDNDSYAIAVYNVPDLDGEKVKLLAANLKKKAFLKREGKKDLKPSRVVILPEPGGLSVVVYLFARSDEITITDKRVELTAQIGRLSLTQFFYPPEMQLQGQLEL